MRASRRTPRQFTMAHGLMVLAGVITFLTVSSLLRDRNETITVVVASQELLAGSEVAANAFRAVDIPADNDLATELVLHTDLVGGGQLARNLAPGEPLLRSDILPSASEVAQRTITIPVWRSTIAGLGLQIGDHVDLIGNNDSGTVAFLVSDSIVSRLPSASSTGAFGSTSGRESWITVQVDESQALDLATALRSGDIEVVRSTGAPQAQPTVTGAQTEETASE